MTWIDDLEATTAIDPHFVLVGHTWDFVVDGADGSAVRALPVLDRLVAIAEDAGMSFVVVADPALGFSIIELVEGIRSELPDPLTTMRLHREPRTGPQAAPTPTELGAVVQLVAESPTLGAVLVPDGGRWIVDLANLQPAEQQLFARCSALARASATKPGRHGRAAHSAVWWLCRDDTELPSWYLADPCVRLVPVAGPTRGERARLGAALLGVDAQDEQAHEFADATDGMAVRSLLPVADLVDNGQRVQDAATLVRLGVTDDPWRSEELIERVDTGREQLGGRVLGQEHALDKAWMGLTRSLSGLSGVHRPSSGRRPRLVLFLAGPTGVGKTELAKAIAELIFGSEDAILRFDMSGYREPHTAQGLIGAPPGYVGHEGGGTLTNRVRERPFSVILFDEIEKAHPRIFDTFLQVLDEGHLDDGRGIRTYFDQSVIIFTSNLGIVDAQGDQLVTDALAPEEVRAQVEEYIRQHFREELGRPEMLNRLGDAFAVFDFIRPPVDAGIFQMLVNNVVTGTQERLGLELSFAGEALAALQQHCCADLSMGGRGIGNMVEADLVNPLSRWVFDQMLAGTLPTAARVESWALVDGQPSLRVAVVAAAPGNA